MPTRDICICVSGGDGLDAPFDPRFGRAAAFLLTDIDGTSVELVPNTGAEAAHGAGLQAVKLMDAHHVRHVVAGHFGGKADVGLRAIGADMWLAPEGLSAAAVLERFRDHKLARQDG